jgi:hypothetical protein
VVPFDRGCQGELLDTSPRCWCYVQIELGGTSILFTLNASPITKKVAETPTILPNFTMTAIYAHIGRPLTLWRVYVYTTDGPNTGNRLATLWPCTDTFRMKSYDLLSEPLTVEKPPHHPCVVQDHWMTFFEHRRMLKWPAIAVPLPRSPHLAEEAQDF